MSNTNVKYIDLDNFETGEPQIVVKLRGREHTMKPISIDDWVANTKAVARLIRRDGNDDGDILANVEENRNIAVEVLMRAFPTMTEDDLGSLTWAQINQLQEMVVNAPDQKDGELLAKEAAKAEKQENPLPAGQ